MNSETLCRKCYGWKECPNRKGMECKILIEREKRNDSICSKKKYRSS